MNLDRVPGRRPQACLLTLAFATAFIGCAEPEAPTDQVPASLEGIWETEGYGLLLEIDEATAQLHELTARSCLPSFAMERDEATTPDVAGVLSLPEAGVTIDLQPGQSDDELWMRIESLASRRRLTRRAELPARCSEPGPTDPVAVVDVFTQTFAEHYPFFAAKGIDWAEVSAAAAASVDPETGEEELYDTLVALLEPLRDAHTSLRAPSLDRSFFGSRDSEYPLGPAARERMLQILVEKYLGEPPAMRCNDQIGFGQLAPGVSALILGSFSNYGATYGEGMSCLQQALDEVLVPDLRALVIDLRINFGGADPYGLAIAERLTGQRYLAYTKETRNDVDDPTRWSEGQESWVEPHDGVRFEGPVFVLTSPLSISAAETFTMALMGRTPQVVRIGAATQGVFSDVLTRSLPNGWSFGLANERFLTADGLSFDGPGIPPDEAVPVFRPEDLEAGVDPALERALELAEDENA